SGRVSAFHHLFTNPLLWGAVGLSLVLQVAVVHIGALNHAFDTTPLPADDWLIATALASVVLWAEEARKLAGRLRRARARG
ncbi:MAG TPA: cation-translocating P-type ATPase C-terminal domain-containing protein, partial [Acidimicrobiales bacterium]